MNTVPKNTSNKTKGETKMATIILNAESTKTVLNEVQAHVRTNPIAFENIECAVRVVNKKMADVPEEKKAGCEFVCDIHSNPLNKGHYSTWFKCIHNGKGWYVAEIYRNKCSVNGRSTHLYITKQAGRCIAKGLIDF